MSHVVLEQSDFFQTNILWLYVFLRSVHCTKFSSFVRYNVLTTFWRLAVDTTIIKRMCNYPQWFFVNIRVSNNVKFPRNYVGASQSPRISLPEAPDAHESCFNAWQSLLSATQWFHHIRSFVVGRDRSAPFAMGLDPWHVIYFQPTPSIVTLPCVSPLTSGKVFRDNSDWRGFTVHGVEFVCFTCRAGYRFCRTSSHIMFSHLYARMASLCVSIARLESCRVNWKYNWQPEIKPSTFCS